MQRPTWSSLCPRQHAAGIWSSVCPRQHAAGICCAADDRATAAPGKCYSWAVQLLELTRCVFLSSPTAHGAYGVVVSHPLRMRKALGSNPCVSILSVVSHKPALHEMCPRVRLSLAPATAHVRAHRRGRACACRCACARARMRVGVRVCVGKWHARGHFGYAQPQRRFAA